MSKEAKARTFFCNIWNVNLIIARCHFTPKNEIWIFDKIKLSYSQKFSNVTIAKQVEIPTQAQRWRNKMESRKDVKDEKDAKYDANAKYDIESIDTNCIMIYRLQREI